MLFRSAGAKSYGAKVYHTKYYGTNPDGSGLDFTGYPYTNEIDTVVDANTISISVYYRLYTTQLRTCIVTGKQVVIFVSYTMTQ